MRFSTVFNVFKAYLPIFITANKVMQFKKMYFCVNKVITDKRLSSCKKKIFIVIYGLPLSICRCCIYLTYITI